MHIKFFSAVIFQFPSHIIHIRNRNYIIFTNQYDSYLVLKKTYKLTQVLSKTFHRRLKNVVHKAFV